MAIEYVPVLKVLIYSDTNGRIHKYDLVSKTYKYAASKTSSREAVFIYLIKFL